MNLNNNTENNEEYQLYKRTGAIIDLRSMPIHEALRIARCADGLTMRNVVDIFQFSSVPRYSLIESGQRKVPAHLMEKVEAYLYDAVEPLKEEA
ncbi:hypothetical protein PDK43_27265 [Bacillus cereus group sp. BcHK10]|uniref:hypothetical protein n=1 Tax=Bacillus cereus group sp. BcHK10 TaxID=3018096 RepID=UPI0022E6E02C|nr:hypothetical protein [Bacillus cereus group sp. BcHK10]MDA1963680.1 hypothetical protein [Bacillus cereus group sp. BcHK10]